MSDFYISVERDGFSEMVKVVDLTLLDIIKILDRKDQFEISAVVLSAIGAFRRCMIELDKTKEKLERIKKVDFKKIDRSAESILKDLKRWKKENNLTLEEMAKLIGVSKTYMWKFLSNSQSIGVKPAIKLAEITGFDLAEILKVKRGI